MSGARGVRMEPLGGRIRQGVERRRNSLDKPVAIGRCLQMCPVAEQELRITEKLVHPLERKPNPGWVGASPILIKQFSRSAAGNKCSPHDLRSVEACKASADHLVNQVLLPMLTSGLYDSGPHSRTVYDFVFDRLRSIRQDLSVQQARGQVYLSVLEVCVKFHLVSSFIFLSNDVLSFDSHINFSHLLECLKLALILQQEQDLSERDDEDQKTMVAVYLLLNLGSNQAMAWALEQMTPAMLRSEPVVFAMKVTRLYNEKNFVGMFKVVKKLPLLPLLALHWKLPQIFREVLSVMSVAYNSKVLCYPMETFSSLYLLDAVKVTLMCQEHKVAVEGSDKICFSKATFQPNDKPKWRSIIPICEAVENADWESIFMLRCRKSFEA